MYLGSQSIQFLQFHQVDVKFPDEKTCFNVLCLFYPADIWLVVAGRAHYQPLRLPCHGSSVSSLKCVTKMMSNNRNGENCVNQK